MSHQKQAINEGGVRALASRIESESEQAKGLADSIGKNVMEGDDLLRGVKRNDEPDWQWEKVQLQAIAEELKGISCKMKRVSKHIFEIVDPIPA